MIEKNSTDLTILLVEDAEDSRYFMRLGLEQHGYRVIEAEDGEKAVVLARREHPDIILMDLSLPGMDGFAATKQIRIDDHLHKVPIIAVTAHQEMDLRPGAKESGFDAYVTKPIEMDWLIELIGRLIL